MWESRQDGCFASAPAIDVVLHQPQEIFDLSMSMGLAVSSDQEKSWNNVNTTSYQFDSSTSSSTDFSGLSEKVEWPDLNVHFPTWRPEKTEDEIAKPTDEETAAPEKVDRSKPLTMDSFLGVVLPKMTEKQFAIEAKWYQVIEKEKVGFYLNHG